MKIILLGANGQLGSEIKRHAKLINDFQLIAFAKHELDITDVVAINIAFKKHQPNIVINAAAYTQVDKAEAERDLVYSINADGAVNIAQACAELNSILIHVSTDYIFNGDKKDPYVETDAAAPIGIYGASKWQGEEKIRKVLAKHIILRVSWVYGYYGHNFVKTILRLAREREELKIVNDQKGCPTSAPDIAEVIYQIIKKQAEGVAHWGTYHFCNTPSTTWYEFAKVIVELASQYERFKVNAILPITTQQYPTPAKRPANSVLDCQKLLTDYSVNIRSWQQALTEVIKEFYQ